MSAVTLRNNKDEKKFNLIRSTAKKTKQKQRTQTKNAREEIVFAN